MNDAIGNQSYSRLAIVGGVALFVVLAYWDSFAGMLELWQLSDHHHGTLVLPIAAFLVWRVRNQLATATVEPDKRGILIVALLSFGWLLARLTSIQVIEHLMVLALIPAAAFAFVGPSMTSKLLFPLLFLMLATPVSDALIPHLMRVTADISTALLRLSGFPVFRQGQYISLPGGEFVVADVCSGVRYLLTGIMISSLFAYLSYQTKGKRVAFVAITASVLVIANGVRAYIVMAIASATNLQYFGGRDHIYFGWMLFGVVIMVLMWFGMKYADDEFDLDADTSVVGVKEGRLTRLPLIGALFLVMLAVTVKPLEADFAYTGLIILVAAVMLAGVLIAEQRQQSIASGDPGRRSATHHVHLKGTVVIAAAAIALVSPPLLLAFASTPTEPVQAPVLAQIGECGSPGEWTSAWEPKLRDPDYEVKASYRCGDQQVNLFMAGYDRSSQGKELISSSSELSAPDWARYSDTGVRALSSSVSGMNVLETVVRSPRYEGITWYWYDIDGQTTTTGLLAKVLQSIALLTRRPSGGMVVLLETRISGDENDARRALTLVAEVLRTRRQTEADSPE